MQNWKTWWINSQCSDFPTLSFVSAKITPQVKLYIQCLLLIPINHTEISSTYKITSLPVGCNLSHVFFPLVSNVRSGAVWSVFILHMHTLLGSVWQKLLFFHSNGKKNNNRGTKSHLHNDVRFYRSTIYLVQKNKYIFGTKYVSELFKLILWGIWLLNEGSKED